jgi:GT2 family glycosyltransferase
MNQPKVTVIIVVYNAEGIRNIFKECLDSALNLKYDNYEVIVVNNGSTDRTREILEDYEKDLRIINLKKNIGPAGARNIAYENSRSEFVLLLDSDVIPEQDSLKELVKIAINNIKIGALSGIQVDYKKRNITSLGRLSEVNSGTIYIDNIPSIDEIKESYYSYFPAYLLVRRKSVGNTLHPKEFFMYVEDNELCFRIWSRGYYVKLIPIVACRHEFRTSVKGATIVNQNIIKKLNYSYHKNTALLTTIYKRYLPNVFLLHVFSKLFTLPIVEMTNFPRYLFNKNNYNYTAYYPLVNLTYLKYYMKTISTINEYGENIPLLINIKGSWKYLFYYPRAPYIKLNYYDSIIKEEDIIRSGRKFLITKKI